MISEQRLKELFSYNPETGIFSRLKARGPCRAGSEAGRDHIAGYRHICIDKQDYLCHRLAFLYMTGRMPVDQVDHINHVRNDNRWENLREAGYEKNSKNKKIYASNRSGINGVAWKKKDAVWHARISIAGEEIHLGSFKDLFSAACARKSAEVLAGYHENNGSR